MPALTEEQAIEALRRVQGLSPEAFERALHDEVGQPLLAVFNALARALHPSDDEDAIAKKLHLMMLAFLMGQRPA
jgi:hypothetical protein